MIASYLIDKICDHDTRKKLEHQNPIFGSKEYFNLFSINTLNQIIQFIDILKENDHHASHLKNEFHELSEMIKQAEHLRDETRKFEKKKELTSHYEHLMKSFDHMLKRDLTYLQEELLGKMV